MWDMRSLSILNQNDMACLEVESNWIIKTGEICPSSLCCSLGLPAECECMAGGNSKKSNASLFQMPTLELIMCGEDFPLIDDTKVYVT
jgi:hypothetical protein